MSWQGYPVFSYFSLLTFVAAMWPLAHYQHGRWAARIADWLIIAGILSIFFFIAWLWIDLERPPLRTLGETRLWYAAFMPVIGFLVLKRWRYSWFSAYCLVMGLVFLLVNLLRPELHDKTLMPALQSVWFVPHVIVYITAYSLLGASVLAAVAGLYYFQETELKFVHLADNLVYLGFGFLTLGLVFGALWAKEAWGHYWTWDPKETWALLTWLGYLVYVHIRFRNPKLHKLALWTLVLSFLLLLICWFGMNYLPAAGESIHAYAS